MKNKRNIIISIIILITIILGAIVLYIYGKDKDIPNENLTNEIINEKLEEGTIGFLNSISGIKAENMEIINQPVIGVKGKVIVPEVSIINGIKYYLKSTKNDKMSNLEVDIQNNSIDLYVNYAVNDSFNTPIKVNITPSLNENKDLVINIGEVKVLDLKLANFLVNLALKTFVKDWFNDSNMKVDYEKSKVIIYKENFEGIDIDSILVNNDDITLGIIIDARKILN
ncbi:MULTISPECIES: hypothetical protein [unclassified Clostridium]|uniref:hypothetical protein n=1 Tax=Clostridium TaxID=1485 RepID=UPI001C8C78A6|nr:MULTISPECIES: hypothetical protein [unclassified Clostridium]MBX9139180.1 hypothetical protein [Clostridium sp. K12(2020)]MBX9145954.1 hypothetical protein [Clostridium sp. K13]MDU2292120.1 hypothetical protein [Clostridium celatum]MDU4327014.1 hypothetical protein [Clostridium celatum]